MSIKNSSPKANNYYKVLVLMAVYNGEKWIKPQIDSILNQKKVDVTLMIRDDFSTDHTSKILKSYESYSNIKIILSKKNSGGAAKNFYQLILDSKPNFYDFIALSDQDDIFDTNKLYCGCDILFNSECSGYSSSVLSFWRDGKNKILKQSHSITELDFLFEGAGQGCTFIIKATTFIKIKYFITSNKKLIYDFFFHDWLIYLLVRSWGLQWFFDNSVYTFYRQHSNNTLGSRGSIKAIKYRLKLILNGWYKKQLHLAFRIFKQSFYLNNSKSKLNLAYEFSTVFLNQNRTLLNNLYTLRMLVFHSRRRILDRVILLFAFALNKL
jgi:rhamnosyltransferase